MSAGPDSRTGSTPAPDASRPAPTDLRATVVRYEGEPDRCTVFPDDADDAAITTHWLSANADCFVPLDDLR
ncbi:DUF7511 domain-containing protein [Candidatus Halobonum tyrrellensis]|nr:hypothetical protein [Candidatus Halobonum tyrrellensis]